MFSMLSSYGGIGKRQDSYHSKQFFGGPSPSLSTFSWGWGDSPGKRRRGNEDIVGIMAEEKEVAEMGVE